ncbi:hypothetical protein [Pseudophaeobacter flagellatus]|uniref:hypothetical protein n=1 Tax=Pseudophaeobacter flagellatus TaxID=2899119 RepID=UPI001E48D322|nr:hypothetical protein [Pseudophaeobacter flagellatus]MCD9148229.1 hypothetical protein [Pseudophaeobacter flagellatus]
MPTEPEATAFLTWLAGYLAAFLLLLWLSRQFRESFLDWITLKDPLGLRFWRQNILFAAFSLAYFAVAVLFLGS